MGSLGNWCALLKTPTKSYVRERILLIVSHQFFDSQYDGSRELKKKKKDFMASDVAKMCNLAFLTSDSH